VQGVHRPSKVSEFANLSEIVERLAVAGSAQSRGGSIFGSIEGLPQGVRAGIFPKGLGDFQVSSGGLVPSSVERRRSKFVLQAGKFREEELG
jgi:hypothetical protein